MRAHDHLEVKSQCRESIEPLMKAHGLGVPKQIVMDTEGWVNPCFFVDEQYVVRFNARDTEMPKFAREVVAMGRLADAGLPVPGVHCFDDSRSVAPFDVLITEWLPGTNLDLLWPDLSADERTSLASQAGELLARLHQLQFSLFGEVIGDWGSQSKQWSWFVDHTLQTELTLAEQLGVFDEDERERFTKMAWILGGHSTK